MTGIDIVVNKINFENVAVGDKMPELSKGPLDLIQLVKYAGASLDFNPLHYDPKVGKAAGTGIIAQGMLIMGFAGQAITDWIPKKYLKTFSVRFVGMTKIGDIVSVIGKVIDKKDEKGETRITCNLLVKNQRDENLLTGSFEAVLPSKAKGQMYTPNK